MATVATAQQLAVHGVSVSSSPGHDSNLSGDIASQQVISQPAGSTAATQPGLHFIQFHTGILAKLIDVDLDRATLCLCDSL